MWTTRKFATSIIAGAIAGLAGMMLALMPTALVANSSWHSPESDTSYVADSVWSDAGPSDDFPWN